MAKSITGNPLVSIGMPAYNGEPYIGKALSSLLAQNYENLQFIISDNASTDATLRICSEYAKKDVRISIHIHRQNIGALQNFRTVLEQARGKYFMWAAVDDYWHPDFVGALVKELECHPEAGVAMCAVNRVMESGELLDTIRFIGSDDPHFQTYFQMAKSLTSFKKFNLYIYGLFRRDLLTKASVFMPDVPGGDRLFICQMALATRFRYIDEILHVRLHHSQPSHVRLPEESFNRIQNEGKWVSIKILRAFARMIYNSTVVPRHRKLYMPVILSRYSRMLCYMNFTAWIKAHLPTSTLKKLQKYLR